MTTPYDPTILDLNGCHADVSWLRAYGITNMPDRLETLLKEYDCVVTENRILREAIRQARDICAPTPEVIVDLQKRIKHRVLIALTFEDVECGDWPAPCNHDPAHVRG